MLNQTYKNAENKRIPLNLKPVIPQISKQRLSIKLPLHSQRYSDLNSFRQEIEQNRSGTHHRPFSHHKKSSQAYRVIFFGFAFLFGVLGITTMAVPSALPCGFFSWCTLVKGTVISMCTMFSLASLAIALNMRVEKEIVLKHVRNVRNTLAKIYAGKKSRMGVGCFLTFLGPKRHQALALRQMYHEAADKIAERKDIALQLTHRIAISHAIEAEDKEVLLNQAIEELNEQMLAIVNSFRHAPLHSAL